MTTFRTKTLRCEWQVVVTQQTYDYDYTRHTSAKVLSRWPTAEEAYNDLSNHGYEHKYVKNRWVPNDATSEYECLEVRYQEVLVAEQNCEEQKGDM